MYFYCFLVKEITKWAEIFTGWFYYISLDSCKVMEAFTDILPMLCNGFNCHGTFVLENITRPVHWSSLSSTSSSVTLISHSIFEVLGVRSACTNVSQTPCANVWWRMGQSGSNRFWAQLSNNREHVPQNYIRRLLLTFANVGGAQLVPLEIVCKRWRTFAINSSRKRNAPGGRYIINPSRSTSLLQNVTLVRARARVLLPSKHRT